MKRLFFLSWKKWHIVREDVIGWWNLYHHVPVEELQRSSDAYLFKCLLELVKDEVCGFRSVLAYRGGRICKWICRFYPPKETPILWIGEAEGGGLLFWHPFATIINADHVGIGCVFRNNTTIGNKLKDGKLVRPWLGNHVNVGVNATIVGGI